jgi:hypothetical protein
MTIWETLGIFFGYLIVFWLAYAFGWRHGWDAGRETGWYQGWATGKDEQRRHGTSAEMEQT